MNALDCYIDECKIHSGNLLNADDEQSLLILAKSGDQRALEKLVQSNQRLVMKIAKRYKPYAGDQELMDLVQWGNLGMMEAIKRFDVSRGLRFTTYALDWIVAYIRRYALVRGNRLSITYKQTEHKVKVASARSKLAASLQREPSPDELSDFTGLTSEIVGETLILLQGCVSYDEISFGDEKEPEKHAGITMPDRDTESTEDAGSAMFENKQVRIYISQLSEHERYVLIHRYGIECEPQNLSQIGDSLGLSRSRIRKIESEALSHLAAILTINGPDGLSGWEVN